MSLLKECGIRILVDLLFSFQRPSDFPETEHFFGPGPDRRVVAKTAGLRQRGAGSTPVSMYCQEGVSATDPTFETLREDDDVIVRPPLSRGSSELRTAPPSRTEEVKTPSFVVRRGGVLLAPRRRPVKLVPDPRLRFAGTAEGRCF